MIKGLKRAVRTIKIILLIGVLTLFVLVAGAFFYRGENTLAQEVPFEDANKVIQFIDTLDNVFTESTSITAEQRDVLLTTYNNSIKPITEKYEDYSIVSKDLNRLVHEIYDAQPTSDGNYTVDLTKENIEEVVKSYAGIGAFLLNNYLSDEDIKKALGYIEENQHELATMIFTTVENLATLEDTTANKEDIEGFISHLISGLQSASSDKDIKVEEVTNILKSSEDLDKIIKDLTKAVEEKAIELKNGDLVEYINTLDKLRGTN